MTFTNWRGIVGFIKPSMSAGPFEEMVRLLPDGVGAIQAFMDLPEVRGPDRLEAAHRQLDAKMAELAAAGVDIVFPEGSAVYMMNGVKGERDLIRTWERKHKTAISPTGLTFVNAMKAMKFRKIVGLRPFTWVNGADFTGKYFESAGFDVLTIASPAGFDRHTIEKITPHDVYKTAKKAFLDHPGADGICILASIMSSTDIIQTLEDDLGVPVVTATTSRCWQAQKHLRVRQPREGYGRLLRELP